MGHIEDVVILEEFRSNNIGRNIINLLIKEAKKNTNTTKL